MIIFYPSSSFNKNNMKNLTAKQQVYLKVVMLLEFLINSTWFYYFHLIISHFYRWRYFKNSVELVKNYVGGNNKKGKLPFYNLSENIKNYKVLRAEGIALNNLSLVFICDGNRRWAVSHKLPKNFKNIKGVGLSKISEVISYSYIEGAKAVSFYILSVRNLSREGGEIDDIIKFIKGSDVFQSPFQIRFYGDFGAMNDSNVIEIIEKIEKMSSPEYNSTNSDYDNSFTVNFFFCYNASVCDVDPNNKSMYFDQPVDLLIRTSGVKRLSDFMSRQVSKGLAVEFVDTNWPSLQLTQIYLIAQKHLLEEKFIK